ncbi:hypothetical protein BBJ28_00023138, partial [Nothophytophthora sp. Chile5]
DAAFLEGNGIEAVISLGTGNLAPKFGGLPGVLYLQRCAVLLVDILDMEEELLLPHFGRCIAFLQEHLAPTKQREQARQPAAALVHCVYGQSRSAAICVAFLMATQRLTMLEAYDIVQRARPCISINPGFLRQLELFQRMQNNPDIMGDTSAHAELRTMMARQQRLKTGTAEVIATPQLEPPGTSFVITTQLSFHLNASELAVLFPDMAVDTSIELAFALFDPASKGVVDSCELLASLVLVAPQLSRGAKQKAIFQLFNVSTHRVGLLVADEATLLFRTVAVGAAKVLRGAGSTAEEFPQLAYFENLTKTLYGEEETLSYEDFARQCQVTAEIDAFMAQWTHASIS